MPSLFHLFNQFEGYLMNLYKYIKAKFNLKLNNSNEQLEQIREQGFIKFKIRTNEQALYITFNFETMRLITAVKYKINHMLKEVKPIKITESDFIQALNTI